VKTDCATCSLCEAACGLSVEHDGSRVFAIRGDQDDPFSRGFMCPKALGLKDIHDDVDRLRTPLVRVDGQLRPASWSEALQQVARRLADIQRAHGADAVGVYRGNPLGHSYAGRLAALLFGGVLGSRSQFSAQSVDALARLFALFHMYGNQALVPVPDVERTEYLLMFGANPVVSNGSLMTLPHARQKLRALRARGGKLVVVDPRRSETAEEADEHVFVRPGSDAFVLMGMLHVIVAERLERLDHLASHVAGLAEVRALALRFPPARVAEISGVPAATIERLARELAAARCAACYGRMGTSTQRYGALASWLIELLNVVTGNLDRPGGVLFNTPAADLPGIAAAVGKRGSYLKYRSRVGGLPEFAGELPVAALADEIETAGPGQIRALVTIAGNPVLSVPNGRRLDRALAGLEFMVAIDIYLNETTRHADVILPTTFGLERDHYPILSSATAVRNRARYSPALLAAPGLMHDWQVLAELSGRLLAERGRRFKGWLLRMGMRLLKARHVLALMIRLGPHGSWHGLRGLTLRKLRGHGRDLGPLEPRLPDVLGTADKRIELAPEPLVRDVERLDQALAARASSELLLIGRRQLRSNNSWMHNVPKLVSGKDRCTLLVHPADAQRLGLGSGARARISSRVGSVVAPVEVSDEVMQGVVSLPHGWGHDRPGVQLHVATRHPGVSANDVVDEQLFDPLSGTSHLNGVPVHIEPAD
jgi:anaerobic selenocysteine-containing dehydrogenase